MHAESVIPVLSKDDLALGRSVGKGSTAHVFVGKLKEKPVAVKKPLPNVAQDPILQQAFERELQVLRLLSHPNLVRLVGVLENPACVVIELCAGGSLFNLLHCSVVDIEWRQQFKMARDIADAMGYLHALEPQVIHLDLKSPNCLLAMQVASGDDVPHVKVADFGSAWAHGVGWTPTRACGTGHWMAPEVALGTGFSTKADVFSYGMMLSEILCLAIPFEQCSAQQAVAMLVSGRRPCLEAEQFPPECPQGMIALMRRCWTPDPLGRPDFEKIQGMLDAWD